METKTVITVVKASRCKFLRCRSDGWIAGTEIHFGYTFYFSGRKLGEPLLELPEHYEEVYLPVNFLEGY